MLPGCNASAAVAAGRARRHTIWIFFSTRPSGKGFSHVGLRSMGKGGERLSRKVPGLLTSQYDFDPGQGAERGAFAAADAHDP